MQSSRAPAWWAGAAALPTDAADLADRVERGIATELHRGRPDAEHWTVALTAQQANAWLTHRLPLWLANQRAAGAPEAPTPDVRVAMRAGTLHLGARPTRDGRVVSIALRPRDGEPGADPSFRIGRLTLPSAWVLPAMRDAARDDKSRALLSALTGASAAKPSHPPSNAPSESAEAPALSLPLEDGRRVRLIGVRIEPDRLLLTCATDRAR